MLARDYELEGCRLTAGPPAQVGGARGHFWFSKLHLVEGRDVLCEVTLTEDKAQGQWPGVLYLSRDGGMSWNVAGQIESYGPASTPLGRRRLLLMPYELWPLSPGDRRNAAARGTIVTCGQDGAVATERTPVKFLAFPRDLADYHQGELCLFTNGNILPLRDGRLLTTLYGKFAGEEKYRCFAAASEDGGLTWRYCSEVASWEDVPDAREGPDESSTARLADGRLMCVYRVGGRQRYHKSYSADDGATWTGPEEMVGLWSVEPQLVRLENGLILLSGGRDGLFVWVCADGEGKRWARLNLAEHHNALVLDGSPRYSDSFCAAEKVDPSQSTSYTGMVAVGPDEVLISYDRLANGWAGPPGPWSDEDMVFCVRLKAVPSTGRG